MIIIGCSDCRFKDLTAIVIDEMPAEEIVKEIPDVAWQKVIAHFLGEDSSGVASVFLGANGLLDYAKIHNLDTGEVYDSGLQTTENGEFKPTQLLCGGLVPGQNMADKMKNYTALREIVGNSLNYLEGERAGNFTVLTTENSPKFKNGVVHVGVNDVYRILNVPPRKILTQEICTDMNKHISEKIKGSNLQLFTKGDLEVLHGQMQNSFPYFEKKDITGIGSNIGNRDFFDYKQQVLAHFGMNKVSPSIVTEPVMNKVIDYFNSKHK